MKSIDMLKIRLKERLTEERFKHSIGVYQTCLRLAKIYKISEEKAAIAGLLHDYARDLSEIELREYINQYKIDIDDIINNQIVLAHGYVGAELIKNELDILDEDILNSIKFHTTGRMNMSELEKIVFLSDYIEPNRSFPKVDEFREIALSNLDIATLMALNNTIFYIINKGHILHPLSVMARNSLLIKASKHTNK